MEKARCALSSGLMGASEPVLRCKGCLTVPAETAEHTPENRIPGWRRR
jgi:hypothetical protein